jgi:hypothetical protein
MLLPCTNELAWGIPIQPLHPPGKVRLIAVANGLGGVGNRTASQEQVLSPFNPQGVLIGMGWQAMRLFKLSQQMVPAQPFQMRQFLQTNAPEGIGVNEIRSFPQWISNCAEARPPRFGGVRP